MSVTRRVFWGQTLPPLITLVALIVIWQLATPSGEAVRIVPSPADIGAALVRDFWLIIRDYLPITLFETLVGLAFALGLGVLLAAALDIWPLLRRALYPLLIISQTVPLFALAPILILLFGFGVEPKITIVVLFCIFPIVINTLDGLSASPPEHDALLSSFGADRVQRWRLARLPNALPGLFSGLRIAATYSVTGAIVGEYIAPTAGIGRYMRNAYQTFKTAEAFGAAVIVILLSLLVVLLAALLERGVIPWHFTRRRGGFNEEAP